MEKTVSWKPSIRMAFFMSREYIAISFEKTDAQQRDLLTGLLSQIGYEGFEEEQDDLRAFIPASHFEEEPLQDLARSMDLAWKKTRVQEENWNAIWESSFEPVIIPGKVAVRADFHEPVKDVPYEIVITPKMSFGTGHHATTWLMMNIMTGFDFKGKTVLDFGTGTGILAILAEMLGAARVEAIDNDPWCIENAAENLNKNHCTKTEVRLGSELPQGEPFDLLLANINRNFLLEYGVKLVELVKSGGKLIISGLLKEDREQVENAYFPLIGAPLVRAERNNWIALAFGKGEPI
jgi:ribosomal protein L11 methyltransferase